MLSGNTPCVNDVLQISDKGLAIYDTTFFTTGVPALGDPRRERPPAVYGRVINVPTHFNVKLPAIGGHLPNADVDSQLLVVRTCYNGQCKQMQRFRRSFQPKLAGSHPNLRSTASSIFSVLPSGDHKQYFISRIYTPA